MSKREPIIDIHPVDSARDKTGSAHSFQRPSYGKQATNRTAQKAPASVVGSGSPAKKPSKLAGAVQTAVGGAIMVVGVPLLILPGPGLLAIGGGAVLAGGGLKKLLGK